MKFLRDLKIWKFLIRLYIGSTSSIVLLVEVEMTPNDDCQEKCQQTNIESASTTKNVPPDMMRKHNRLAVEMIQEKQKYLLRILESFLLLVNYSNI